MAITPIAPEVQKRIVKNVVSACKNINKLNRTGYGFIYQANGFIAHYDLHGFIAYYTENSLRADIKENARQNQWDNFRQGEENYEYYMSMKAIYNAILEQI